MRRADLRIGQVLVGKSHKFSDRNDPGEKDVYFLITGIVNSPVNKITLIHALCALDPAKFHIPDSIWIKDCMSSSLCVRDLRSMKIVDDDRLKGRDM